VQSAEFGLQGGRRRRRGAREFHSKGNWVRCVECLKMFSADRGAPGATQTACQPDEGGGMVQA
jgi:hypothetical protein